MPNSKFVPIFLFGILLLISGRQLHAQIQAPKPGSVALSFGLWSSSDGSVGVRKMMNERANVGLNLSFDLSRTELDNTDRGDLRGHNWSIGLKPDLRLYREPKGTVLPFLDLNAGISYRGHDGGDWSGVATVGTGIGVEWFPVHSMSISGKTGVGLFLHWSESGDSPHSQRTYGVATQTSSLAVNLYF